MYNIEVYSITVCLCLKLFSCGGGATMIIITQFVPKMAKCPTTPISKRNMMKHCVLSSFQARNLHLEWLVHLFPIFSHPLGWGMYGKRLIRWGSELRQLFAVILRIGSLGSKMRGKITIRTHKWWLTFVYMGAWSQNISNISLKWWCLNHVQLYMPGLHAWLALYGL